MTLFVTILIFISIYLNAIYHTHKKSLEHLRTPISTPVHGNNVEDDDTDQGQIPFTPRTTRCLPGQNQVHPKTIGEISRKI